MNPKEKKEVQLLFIGGLVIPVTLYCIFVYALSFTRPTLVERLLQSGTYTCLSLVVLYSFYRSWDMYQMRKALLLSFLNQGVAPKDGQRVTIYGHIEIDTETTPVQSPLSQILCVYYQYVVWYAESAPTKFHWSRKARRPQYTGEAKVPLYISTSFGRVRVSPLFELEKLDQSETIVTDSVDPSKGVPLRDTSSLWYIRMRDYIQNTVFSGSDTVSYDRLMSTGYMRNDLRVFPLDDLAQSYVTEDVLVPGVSVCVSGLWDATTFSLVPGILTKVRIISGDRDKVLEIMRKERNSALMAGLVFLLSFVIFGME